MFFLAPTMIVVMQTGLLTALGMQAIMLPPILPTPGGIGFLAERERGGEGIPDQSGTRDRSSKKIGPRPTASLRLASYPFGLPTRAKDAQGDMRHAA